MSMLSEQVNKIRKVAKCVYLATDKEVADDIARTLKQAADTIETLSAKLAAANMERSDKYYGGGWIACNDRLPEESGDYLITDEDGNSTCAYYNKSVKGWCGIEEGCIAFYPVAWQPLPEPYRP